jgi:hypothetical protein
MKPTHAPPDVSPDPERLAVARFLFIAGAVVGLCVGVGSFYDAATAYDELLMPGLPPSRGYVYSDEEVSRAEHRRRIHLAAGASGMVLLAGAALGLVGSRRGVAVLLVGTLAVSAVQGYRFAVGSGPWLASELSGLVHWRDVAYAADALGRIAWLLESLIESQTYTLLALAAFTRLPGIWFRSRRSRARSARETRPAERVVAAVATPAATGVVLSYSLPGRYPDPVATPPWGRLATVLLVMGLILGPLYLAAGLQHIRDLVRFWPSQSGGTPAAAGSLPAMEVFGVCVEALRACAGAAMAVAAVMCLRRVPGGRRLLLAAAAAVTLVSLIYLAWATASGPQAILPYLPSAILAQVYTVAVFVVLTRPDVRRGL